MLFIMNIMYYTLHNTHLDQTMDSASQYNGMPHGLAASFTVPPKGCHGAVMGFDATTPAVLFAAISPDALNATRSGLFNN
jgi:hypothetical protein